MWPTADYETSQQTAYSIVNTIELVILHHIQLELNPGLLYVTFHRAVL